MFGVFRAFNQVTCFENESILTSLLVIGLAFQNDEDLSGCVFVPVKSGIGLKGRFGNIILKGTVPLKQTAQPGFSR